MGLRSAQKREFIRVKLALEVGYTPISAEDCRRIKTERADRPDEPWMEVDLPERAGGTEAEDLLNAMRLINEKLDYLLQRVCGGEPKRHSHTGVTIDISGGGLCLAAAKPLPMGQWLDMTLALRTWPEIRIDMIGQVQSVDGPDSETDCYKLGIGFGVLREIDRDRLVRYIFQKQRECLRLGPTPA
jgi:c-di-GMP-binding flagellar brake protein YcgR